MPARGGAGWFHSVAASLREHETRRSSVQNSPSRYEILEELSRGGMGVVYRAWDPELGREVALKVLRGDEANTAEAHERFRREAQLAAALDHPGIVRIFDTGTWNGQDYIAMQLVQGTTLDKADLDKRQVLALLRDAARALHYAHQNGIVHRDVKPTNLLLDQSGRIYVTDFGIARAVVSSSGTLTTPGTVLGTPAYMSPEQAQGLDADARSDVYSLGATLYEAMTGEPPYRGRDSLEVIEAVRARDPLSPRKVRADISKNVEAIILGAMERNRQDRYAGAEEFAQEIDRYLRGERPLRRPRGLSYKVRRQFVRHPWRTGAVLVFCALLLLAGTGLGYWIRGYVALNRARELRDDDPLKKTYLEKAQPLFAEAREMLRDIRERELDRKSKEDLAHARMKDEEARRDLEEQLAKLRAEADKKERERLIATTYASVVRLVGQKQLEEARKYFALLDKEAPDRAQELLPKLVDLEFEVGADQVGRLAASTDEAAFAGLFRSLADPKFASQQDRESKLALVAFQHAASLADRGRAADSIPWFGEAESRGFKEARLNEKRGLAQLRLEQWDRAQRDLDELRNRSPANFHPAAPFAELPYRRGKAAMGQGRWSEALKELEDTLGINPNLAGAYHDRGLVRFRAYSLSREALDEDLKTALAQAPNLAVDPAYRDVALAFCRTQVDRTWKAEDFKKREKAWRDSLFWIETILKKGGEHAGLRQESARMHRRLREYPAALKDLDVAGKGPEAAVLRGQILFVQATRAVRDEAKLRESLAEFERGLVSDPRNVQAAYGMAICRQMLSDPGAPASLEAGPPWGDLHLRRANSLLDSKRDAGAEKAAEQALGVEELSEDEYVARLGEDRGESCSTAWRRFRMEALYARARARFRLQNLAGSEEDCTAALRLDESYGLAWFQRGLVRYAARDYDAAIADFGKAVEVDPKDFEALVSRGTARLQKGQTDAAIADFSAALLLNPKYPEALYARAGARILRGDLKGARLDYENCLKHAAPDWAYRSKVEEALKKL